MKSERYSLSFTAGGLFHRESVELATLFLDLHDWNAVRGEVLAGNLLQARTLSSSKRICREICSRLKTLDHQQLDLLVHGTAQEQGYLLWVAACRRYPFIADFAIEVIRERYLSLKADLHYEDFDAFFNKKSEWHSELDALRPATRNKLRQVLFKMLHEAGLLTVNNTINPAMPSPRLVNVIAQGKQPDVLVLPVFEPREWTSRCSI